MSLRTSVPPPSSGLQDQCARLLQQHYDILGFDLKKRHLLDQEAFEEVRARFESLCRAQAGHPLQTGDDIARDPYEPQNKSQTIAVELDGCVVGTLRVVFGGVDCNAQNIAPLEILNLTKGLDLEPIEKWCEVGRFALNRTRVRDDAVRTAIAHCLLRHAFSLARQAGMPRIAALMPPHVAKRAVQGGYAARRLPGVVDYESPHVIPIAYHYPLYWLPRKPSWKPAPYEFVPMSEIDEQENTSPHFRVKCADAKERTDSR